MNTKIRQSWAPRHGRLAALALTGAIAAGVMALPLGMGVANASAGFPSVQAGGPPAEPVKHVSKPRYVPREKPILHHPRWRPPNIDVIIDNDNRSRNRQHHRFDRRHEEVRRDVVKPEPVKDDKEDKIDKIEPEKRDDGNWWWPDGLD
ncbi:MULTISPECIES: hypothetical protein [unclassified Nonomuraea]|uniref:hypothetical protein n=1 Tax=unclassified Nonomuraea TaxID=2593643 RepID=UPI0035C077F3